MRRTFLFLALALFPSLGTAKPVWREARIPLLPSGAALGSLWAGLSGDLYLWAQTLGGPSRDVPTAHLLHWDGREWRAALTLAGHEPAGIFGTDGRNMFAAANRCLAGPAAGCGEDRGGTLFRSTDGGATWQPQALPPDMGKRFFGRLDGSYNNIQAVVDHLSLLRFDGVAWNWSFTGDEAASGKSLSVTFQGANEGYLVNCAGWGRWIGGVWKFMPVEFGFCDARGLWGLRDRGGDLRLYAADSHKFSNGIRIWKFRPALEDFEVELEESSDDAWGETTGLWGSAEDDIYAIGRIGDPGRPGSGRVYHFDGTAWTRANSMGPIPAPLGIHGTSRNDVWIALADGRLLHYSTSIAVTRKMSGFSTAP